MIPLAQTNPESGRFQDNDLVCYCFSHTKKDIERDFQIHGFSTILEKIKNEKKNNGCNCAVENPKGR